MVVTGKKSERSRSPARRRFSAKFTPQIKDWVLVQTSGNPHKFQIKAATAALVSGVETAMAPDDVSKVTISFTLLVPNMLTLQHGFGGARFKELHRVPLNAIRPYRGNDKALLRERLLEAMRAEFASRGPAEARISQQTKCMSKGCESTVSDQGETVAQETGAALPDTTLETEAAAKDSLVVLSETEFNSSQPIPFEAQIGDEATVCEMEGLDGQQGKKKEEQDGQEVVHDASEEGTETVCVPKEGTCEQVTVGSEQLSHSVPRDEFGKGRPEVTSQTLDGAKQQAGETPDAPALSPEPMSTQPKTPAASRSRELERRVTPPKPPADMGGKGLAVKQACVSKQRLRTITAMIARAFVAAKDTVLSKQDLALGMAKAGLGEFTEAELPPALVALDQMNKVYVSGDLVFLVN